MAQSIPPERDQDALDWARIFVGIVSLHPENYGLSSEQCSAFQARVDSYGALLLAATEPGTRTRVTVQLKNGARDSLRGAARQLIRIVDAFPATTDATRAALSMHVRDAVPTPIPAPATQPIVNIRGSGGGVARLLLRDRATPDKPAKPRGVLGALIATVLTAPGEPTPEFPTGSFQAIVTRTRHRLALPPDSAGKTLWVQARWINHRGMPGPASAISSVMVAA